MHTVDKKSHDFKRNLGGNFLKKCEKVRKSPSSGTKHGSFEACLGIWRAREGHWGEGAPLVRYLSGMFCRSASLAIPHLVKSIAAIPSVSAMLLGHTNRNVNLSHESQCEIAFVYAHSRPISDNRQGEGGKQRAFASQGLLFIRNRIATESHETMPLPDPPILPLFGGGGNRVHAIVLCERTCF